MQEFSSWSEVSPAKSFVDSVSAIAAALDHLPEVELDLSTLEAGVATLIAGQLIANGRLLEAVEQLIEQSSDNELRLRELKKIHFQLADMTDNFIEEVD